VADEMPQEVAEALVPVAVQLGDIRFGEVACVDGSVKTWKQTYVRPMATPRIASAAASRAATYRRYETAATRSELSAERRLG
jgi:hypothetical protein